ncbi:hypothetical protein GF325_10225 [Candidatus Bathyarchaeota archaeon]|nr:hypothetical protein [Candidatus Bathyarchaeota archaeon]
MTSNSIETRFAAAIRWLHARASLVKLRTKQLRWNSKITIQMPGNDTKDVIKLTTAWFGKIPATRFEPVLVKTRKSHLWLIGTRLSRHGGEIAVRVARRISTEYQSKLVVLGTNIIAFSMVYKNRIVHPILGGSRVNESDRNGFRDAVELYSKMHDSFNVKLNKIIKLGTER